MHNEAEQVGSEMRGHSHSTKGLQIEACQRSAMLKNNSQTCRAMLANIWHDRHARN